MRESIWFTGLLVASLLVLYVGRPDAPALLAGLAPARREGMRDGDGAAEDYDDGEEGLAAVPAVATTNPTPSVSAATVMPTTTSTSASAAQTASSASTALTPTTVPTTAGTTVAPGQSPVATSGTAPAAAAAAATPHAQIDALDPVMQILLDNNQDMNRALTLQIIEAAAQIQRNTARMQLHRAAIAAVPPTAATSAATSVPPTAATSAATSVPPTAATSAATSMPPTAMTSSAVTSVKS